MYTLTFLTYKIHKIHNVLFYKITKDYYIFKIDGDVKYQYIKRSDALLINVKKHNN